MEARSVVRGLPFFIRDHFQIKPSFFCSSSLIVNVLQCSWISSTRKYTSQDEMEQQDKFGLLTEEIAPKEQFISTAHQKSLAAEDDKTIFSVETQLTKGDAAPPTAKSEGDNISALTGETRESKAKAYAAAESKKVAAAYSDTVATLQQNLNSKDKDIMDLKNKLELLLNKMSSNEMGKEKAVIVRL